MGANEQNNVSTPPDDSPKCPECGGETHKRTSGKTGAPFWGCKRWPACVGLVDCADMHTDADEHDQRRAMIDNAFRRELSRDVLLKLIERAEYWEGWWQGDKTIGQVAVAIADELVEALQWMATTPSN